MTEAQENFKRLFSKWMSGELLPEEELQFFTYWQSMAKNVDIDGWVKENWRRLPVQPFDGQHAKDKIMQLIAEQPFSKPTVPGVHFMRTAWFRYAAAIIILFSIGAYFYTTTQKKNQPLTENKPVPVKNDIPPGSDRAILTLSNGQQVILDNAASETIIDQTLSIENNNGQLIYKNNNLVAINTMSTPKGGQYQLTLADGTRVWLNAASSITYPTAFTGKNRQVQITGEAYFEVRANKAKPFIVKTTTDEIIVLGTSFNVNAYADEIGVRTSLIEGAIKIGDTNIRPGEAYQKGKLSKTNIKQDIAWKNGYFDFDNKNWENALTQLARWYDIEVQVKGSLPESILKGKLGRDLTLSQILSTLDEIGIKTQLKGNTLVVMP